jgi:ABC-type taurine transport system ATPase subunit
VEARHLNVRYSGAEREALHNVSFRLQPGELVAVVGPVLQQQLPIHPQELQVLAVVEQIFHGFQQHHKVV